MMTFSRKALICVFLIAFTFSLITGCASEDIESTSDKKSFTWVKDESQLVDVKIVDNEVQLYYSLCFDNQREYDITISQVGGSFSWFDCWGWLKYQKDFIGETIDGINSATIPAKTKMSVVFVFQGEYLGGKINEDLRFSSLLFLSRSNN